jgi:ABC-2 type transport system ATP-binding protein
MNEPWLIIRDVDFSYSNGFQALKKINLQLGSGIVGLLGPNGAGKSSLMSIISTLAQPDYGHVYWQGEDIRKNPDVLRKILGFLPQSFGVYPALTAREFLQYLAEIKGLPRNLAKRRVEYCLENVGLIGAIDQRLGYFSGGMKQRIGIAQALLNDPKLLIIDEPTVGLDPEERLKFRLLLEELAINRLVILSTHIVSDIETSATSLVVMSAGKLCFHGEPERLIKSAKGKVWEYIISYEVLNKVRTQHCLTNTSRHANGLCVRVVSPFLPDPSAVNVDASLEDAYSYLINFSAA